MKQQVLKRIKDLGAEIEFIPTQDGFNFTIDAPDGYCWAATTASIICGAYYKGQEPIFEAYKRILTDLEMGLLKI